MSSAVIEAPCELAARRFLAPSPTLVTRRQVDMRHTATSRHCRRIAGNVLLHMFVPGTEFIVIAQVMGST